MLNEYIKPNILNQTCLNILNMSPTGSFDALVLPNFAFVSGKCVLFLQNHVNFIENKNA